MSTPSTRGPARRRQSRHTALGRLIYCLCAAAVLLTAVLLAWHAVRGASTTSARQMLAHFDAAKASAPLTIKYPLNEAVFPRDIVAPEFRWEDPSGADSWLVRLEFGDQAQPMSFLSAAPAWTPKASQWEQIKRRSTDKAAKVTILGARRSHPEIILSRGMVSFLTSPHEVGAPLFYREVILPFIEAVKDPARIRWRFGVVSSPKPPPVVLEGLPVCGNCHSFSRDGQVLAMDVDYANSKGSYVITHTAKQMALLPRDVITWDDYRRADGEQTFGLLSQIAPDGQTVVSTVKDRAVFVPKPELEFSQLFFPLKGILAVYERKTRTFHALPGADDPQFVQSNPAWSPDGKHIVFARAKAYRLKREPEKGRVLLTPDECAEFVNEGKPFQFDLYRLPYNDGQGGQPEPLAGASRNGKSNFFPRYSPDGKWIVFCMARNYMLLQPDSELYIIPAQGGVARRLRCNTGRMNSWHSWSPNGHWLVFCSKANSAYTQLWLAHLDQQGNSAPPVLLAHFTAPDRAANIPEFVNLPPGAIERIEARFLNDYSHARAGFVCEKTGDLDRAIEEYRKALELNPGNTHAHERLGYLLYNFKRQPKAGLAHCRQAVQADPDNGQAHYILGVMLLDQNDVAGAIEHFSIALRLWPATTPTDPQFTLAACHDNLGLAWLLQGDYAPAATNLAEAARLKPEDAQIRFSLAAALAHQGLLEEPLQHYQKAISLKPELDKLPQFYDLLAANYAKAGRFADAVQAADKALRRAKAAGRADIAQQIQDRLRTYQANAPSPRAGD